MKRLPRWSGYLLGSWVVLFGLWLLLVDSLAHPEVAAGPVAAALAASIALALRFAGGKRFLFRLRWLRWLASVPKSVLRDSVVLGVALWLRIVRRERPQSAFRAFRFSAVADDLESAAWRAFCIAVTSVAPNTYMIGIDREHKVALVHQLVPDPAEGAHSSVIGADELPQH